MKIRALKKYICVGLMALTIGVCTTACGKDKVTDTASVRIFSVGKEKVYLDEVWIYAKTVMEGYEQKYGSQVWTIETEDTEGKLRTMEDITREDIIEDIRSTKILASKADEFKVSLTEDQKQEAEGQASKFYNNLTDDQINEMGIKRDTVSKVFEENMLADKVYDQLMTEGNVEVSDEEARMTTIYDMYFACYREDGAGNVVPYEETERQTQLECAKEAMTLLDDPENPMDYDAIVSKYGLNYGGSRTMAYAELVAEYGESLVSTLYALENGMHTDVVETEYGYHIIAMVALTDSEATAVKKQTLLDAKEKEYFATRYSEWSEKANKGWEYRKDVDLEAYKRIPFGSDVQE